MADRQIQQALRDIGWPIVVDGAVGPQTRQAVADFQRGWAFWGLGVDGAPGPETQKAIEACLSANGKCSAYFTFREFASKGNGWVKVASALAFGLDRYRERAGGPVVVVSGYRDPARNSAAGGATNSQHLYGNACDLAPRLTVDQVRSLGVFSGVGWNRGSGLVAHVDVRHVGPNTSGGTPANPTTWIYG